MKKVNEKKKKKAKKTCRRRYCYYVISVPALLLRVLHREIITEASYHRDYTNSVYILWSGAALRIIDW